MTPAEVHQLDWERYAELAHYYRWRAPPDEAEDLVQSIILEMAIVATRRDGQGTPDAYLRGIARHVVADFWRQRRPRPLSLSGPVQGTDEIELWETLAATDCAGDPLGALLAKEELDGRYYHRLRAAGRCPKCKGQPEEGFVHCAACRAKHRQEQARWRQQHQWALRARWRQEERCTRCGNPPEAGRRRCHKCLARNRKDIGRWRERNRALALLRQASTCAAQVLPWSAIIAEMERLRDETWRNSLPQGERVVAGWATPPEDASPERG
jgi:hypothetical protein